MQSLACCNLNRRDDLCDNMAWRYEIDVVTPSPFYRSTFARLKRQLTAELGVETGIRWVRPDYLYNGRIGPFPTGLTYPTWGTIQTIQKTIDANITNARNVNLDTDGLNLSLVTHYMADKLHYNTAGCIAVADGMITEAETLGVIG